MSSRVLGGYYSSENSGVLGRGFYGERRFSPRRIPNLISYYDAVLETSFDDADALTPFTDQGVNGYDLTQADSAEQPKWKAPDPNYPGLRQAYVLFDGSDHLQNISDPIEPGTGEFTLFGWMYVADDTTTQIVACKGSSGSTVAGWTVFLEGGLLIVRCNAGGGTTNRASQYYTFGTERLDAGEWISFALVISRGSGSTTITGYFNGSNTGWQNGGGGPSSNTFASEGSITSADPFTLGASGTGTADVANGTRFGAVVAIAGAMSQSEIQQLHNYFSNRTFDSFSNEQTLFSPGVDGDNNYRIPCGVRYKDDTYDFLMVAIEGRDSTADDGDIDIDFKTSTDGGANWSAVAEIANNGSDEAHNPCLIADSTRGVIHCVYCTRDGNSEANIRMGTGSVSVWYTAYNVATTTWSTAVEITSSVTESYWRWIVSGPGAGLILPNGRLIVPGDHSDEGNGNGNGAYTTKGHLFYSDDGGSTWDFVADIGPEGWNEWCPCFMPDGKILGIARNQIYGGAKGNYLFAWSSDNGDTWSEGVEDDELDGDTIYPPLLRVGNRIYTSVPTVSSRDELALYSAIAGTDRKWDRVALYDRTNGAYSSLIDLGGDEIGVVWEANPNTYTDIKFASFVARG